jgi:serine/threonine protein kinase
MPEIGQRVSHYIIAKKIGSGDMCEVCLANDLSLDGKVALKFLSDVFTSDPERMARSAPLFAKMGAGQRSRL